MGKYNRKSNRGLYSKEKLREAVQEVESGRMSGYKASKIYQIPRMTVMDHVNKRRTKSTTLGRNTALSAENEFRLATNLHFMEKYGFGLSRKEVLQLVGDYINKNNLVTPFKNGIPGKDWFLAFKERHGLSIKKPQAVEYSRKKAVDPFIIYSYFDLLEKTINDLNLKYKPSSIWNLDETSFSKDPAKTKIVGAKGHAATRVISTAGKDNTTVLLGASASGEKLPPLIVYKGKNVWETWTSAEAYPGTSYAATKNGWMETEVFESFFKKTFLPIVKDKCPVLLIYDGHSTHVGLNIIEEARKANITILKLPPHTSHVLQPLDIAVMKPFKDRWDALLVQWQRLNIGSVMPKTEFARLIGQVWAGIDSQVLRNGFRKAGIHPVNREEINENQFDSLKLKHWRAYESTRDVSHMDQDIKKTPKSLLTLTLKFFNDIAIRQIPTILEKTNISMNLNITFEELLLQKLKRGDSSPKPRRRKVAPGAEVITHKDVLQKKREEQTKYEKIIIDKKLKKDASSKTPITDDVINISNMSKIT
nr:uncharacterized protein LOC113399291 [Vanessa tameamea]